MVEGGVGSQAMALRDLGVNFEHYRLCEWEASAIASYKAIHCENDNFDYSKDVSKEELVNALVGISVDGKTPLKKEQIAKKGIDWLKQTYNNIKATHNLVDITRVKGGDLGIVDLNKWTYIMTYSFPCQ